MQALRLPLIPPSRLLPLARRYHHFILGIGHPAPSRRELGGDEGTSQVPGQPHAYMPCSQTPVGSRHQVIAVRRCCLPSISRRRLPRVTLLTRLNHTACTLPVYASRPRLPPSAQHSVPAADHALPGGLRRPLGCHEGFPRMLSPFPGFAWRTRLRDKMEPHSTPTGPLPQPLFSATPTTPKLGPVTAATPTKYKDPDLS
jgi:hypothetical protein